MRPEEGSERLFQITQTLERELALGDLADVIDRLCIANLKIWHFEEAIRDESLTDEQIGRLTRQLTPINEERANLKNRITEITGLGLEDPKMYHGPSNAAADGSSPAD